MLPTGKAVIHEAFVVIAGALLAAAVVSQLPMLKAWIKKQWE